MEEFSEALESDMGKGSCPCKRYPEEDPHCQPRDEPGPMGIPEDQAESEYLSHSDIAE